MNFSNAVTTTTREKIIPTVFDTVTKGSPLLMMMLRTAKPWKSGYRYDNIFKYRDSTNGGNIGVADQLDTDRQDVRVKGNFEVKMAYKPVVVANIEEVLNAGDEQIVSLLDAEFDSQAQSLCNLMSQNLYTGTGVGNDWDSLANAADDGTSYSTYANLSRTIYPTLKGYYLGSAGALTLNKLATGYDAVEVGIDKPNAIATTKTLWSAYEALLTPTVRAGYSQSGYPKMDQYGILPKGDSLAGNQGFDVLFFRGTPMMKDEQCPSGKLFYVNTNYFSFKGVDMSKIQGIEKLNFKKTSDGVPMGVPGRVPSTLGFNFRIFMSPVDQLAKVGHLLYSGNFTSENPRLQGQIAGLTA